MTGPALGLVIFGAFVLGMGTNAMWMERLRGRLARWAEELAHERWALDELRERGKLTPDLPVRWARSNPDAVQPVREVEAEPTAAPAPVPVPAATVEAVAEPVTGEITLPRSPLVETVRAAWAWDEAEPARGVGWLNGPAQRAWRRARWLAGVVAEFLYETVLLVVRAGNAMVQGLLWLASREERFGQVARRLWVRSGWLVWSLWLAWRAHPPALQAERRRTFRARGSHELRRGRKPLRRFLDDVKARERDDRQAAYQQRLQDVAGETWLAWEKEMPPSAATVVEQEQAYLESLLETEALARLGGVGVR